MHQPSHHACPAHAQCNTRVESSPAKHCKASHRKERSDPIDEPPRFAFAFAFASSRRVALMSSSPPSRARALASHRVFAPTSSRKMMQHPPATHLAIRSHPHRLRHRHRHTQRAPLHRTRTCATLGTTAHGSQRHLRRAARPFHNPLHPALPLTVTASPARDARQHPRASTSPASRLRGRRTISSHSSPSRPHSHSIVASALDYGEVWQTKLTIARPTHRNHLCKTH